METITIEDALRSILNSRTLADIVILMNLHRDLLSGASDQQLNQILSKIEGLCRYGDNIELVATGSATNPITIYDWNPDIIVNSFPRKFRNATQKGLSFAIYQRAVHEG